MHWYFKLVLLIIPLALAGCGRNSQPTDSRDEKKPSLLASPDGDETKGIVQLQNEAAAVMGQFDFNQAVSLYEQILNREPNSPSARIDLAIALLNRRAEGDLEKSAELLDEELKSAPSNLRALYCRALLYFNDGKTVQAESLFEQVALGDPSDAFAIYYVGQCHFMRGAFKEALDSFQRAQQVDPYLRSAYYGAFQAAQRLQDGETARENLATFKKLADNPRSRVAELKYTRMGPKAEVSRPDHTPNHVAEPTGPMFADARPLPLADGATKSWSARAATAPNITVADINSDGESDIFIAGMSADGSAHNTVLLHTTKGYRRDSTCPLEQVPHVAAALWGDYDDDGLTDVYLCREGPNQLWRQSQPGVWTDATAATQTAAGDHSTIDGLCYDADHDGDLDYLLVNAYAPCELLNNNRDGTFRSIAKELGLPENASGARQVLAADLDGDDDADIVLIKDELPHQILMNDRLWEYHPAENFETFAQTPISCAAAADADVDGRVELYTLSDQQVLRWTPSEHNKWQSEVILRSVEQSGSQPTFLGIDDFDGDAKLEVCLQVGDNVQLLDLDGTHQTNLAGKDLTGPISILIQPQGPELLGLGRETGPIVWRSGSGRYPYALLKFTGKRDSAAEMRSNASGIGVTGAARIGDLWAKISTLRSTSGPGQSLQPIAIGLAKQPEIDFIQLLWPDGVSQTERDFAPGKIHQVVEKQRQSGSCPLVFVWNGKEFEFVADILGAGGIGFNLGKGEYYEPRPDENLLIPGGKIRAKDGKIVVKLGEPMEEICYFDALRLVTYDVPPGWRMALDERFGGTDPQPTGAPFFFSTKSELLPTKVVNERGQDVTEQLVTVDGVVAPLSVAEDHFIGFAEHNALTLTFSKPLDQLADPMLLFDGWVEYAYSQSAFAAWQAGITAHEPTIAARGTDNDWQLVRERFGFMAGTPRRSAVRIPLEKLPQGTRQLRLSTNMQIYWDRIAVIDAAEPDSWFRQRLALVKANVMDVGFSARQLFDQGYTTYDYSQRPPLADTRHPAGFYTAFGDALELVEETDDALAIIGPGEEIHLEFAAPSRSCPAGWTRYFVLEADGWCKDADLFTKSAGTVDPLPSRHSNSDPAQIDRCDELHRKYNIRYCSGR